MVAQYVRVWQKQAKSENLEIWKSGNLEIWKSKRLKLPDYLGKSLTALPFYIFLGLLEGLLQILSQSINPVYLDSASVARIAIPIARVDPIMTTVFLARVSAV